CRCSPANFFIEAVACFFIEGLGVVDVINLSAGWKYDGSRNNGSCQWSHADFIHASDVLNSGLPQQPFAMKHCIQTAPFLLLIVVPLRQDPVEPSCAGTRIALELPKDRGGDGDARSVFVLDFLE